MIFTTHVGSCTVTVLDVLTATRTAAEVAGLFENASPAEVESIAGPEMRWSFNLLLFSFDGVIALVDTGFAFAPGGNGAPTRDLLAEAGVAAADVDLVVLTHGHGDHLGGLLHDGARAFDEADLVVSNAEHAFWTGPNSDALGEERVQPVREALDAYRGRTRIVEPGGTIWETESTVLRSIDAPGHTPGHVGVEVVSGGRRLWALVDTLHAQVQMTKPEWSPRFDIDPNTARETRRHLLSRVCEEEIPVHFFHLAFPGLGSVTRSGDHFAWVPDPTDPGVPS